MQKSEFDTTVSGKKPTVLVVDDDLSGLAYFSLSLKKNNFQVITAQSVGEAKKAINKVGIGRIDCILTDFRMPVRTGLDLLKWVQDTDPSLATIIVTAESEKSLVQESLRGGAADYLEKPVSRSVLEEVISRGVQKTAQNRRLMANTRELKALGRMEQIFKTMAAPELSDSLKYYHRPLSEVGGDFLNVLPLPGERYLLLIGDVSGHDVRAGFISAYFQGMMRGLLTHQSSLNDILLEFNRILISEWAPRSAGEEFSDPVVQASLAVCAVLADFRKDELTILNCGIPAPWICLPNGHCFKSDDSYPPLGWFVEKSYSDKKLKLSGLGAVYICTDGLTEYAENLEVDSFSLIHRLLWSEEGIRNEPEVTPLDDILVMRFQIDQHTDSNDLFEPIVFEQYSGEEYQNIDRLQGVWKRSLQYALSGLLGDRLYDVVLCCREGVINALVHGCDETAGKFCSLQVTCNYAQGILRVRIDDPGHGHSFDLGERLRDMKTLDSAHMGLAIIQNLSDSLTITNSGSTIIFDFNLNSTQ